MSNYPHLAVLICTNRDAGNSLARKAAAYPNDPNAEASTFTDSAMLSPQAWYAAIPSRDTFAGVCQAIADNADYSDPRLDYLKESPRNITEQDWIGAKAIIRAAVFDIATLSGAEIDAFIASHGYSIVEAQP